MQEEGKNTDNFDIFLPLKILKTINAPAKNRKYESLSGAPLTCSCPLLDNWQKLGNTRKLALVHTVHSYYSSNNQILLKQQLPCLLHMISALKTIKYHT